MGEHREGHPSSVQVGRAGSRERRKCGSLHVGGRQDFALGKGPSRQKRKIMKKLEVRKNKESESQNDLECLKLRFQNGSSDKGSCREYR